jgi:Tol biopolymer transport system component
MALSAGVRLGPYEIVSALGAGGMGEVYRARDTKLQRQVALKILPEPLAVESDRRARFEREARMLATLNHPHIAQIYGIAEGDGIPALVMELVDGETLAERIRRGPLPVGEVLAIASQIADALDAAHTGSVIHRDLKPANVMVRADGTVKILDFGLAKALPAGDLDDASTITAETKGGTLVGTAAYMSPEQARGQPVDKRSDIWAFGCVLYEMLTQRRAFPGTTLPDTVAAILNETPDWTLLPAKTPASLHTLLRRCLVKAPERRLRDIGDALLEIDAGIEGSEPAPARRSATSRRGLALRLAVLGAVAGGAAYLMAAWLLPGDSSPATPIRLTIRLPPGVTVTRGPQFSSSIALSPDGETVVISGRDATGQRLYQRSVDGLEVTPVTGTEGGSAPFFSPDGAWIGFFAGTKLKRVPAGGGVGVDITTMQATQFVSGSWGPNDLIVFSAGAAGAALEGVEASGGRPEPVTRLDPKTGEVLHRDPELLSDDRTLLFTVIRQGETWIEAQDIRTGRRTRLLRGVAPRYATTGHLILSRDTALLGVPFDRSRPAITGPVTPLVDSIAAEANGSRHYAISRTGALAYVPGARTHALVMIDDVGRERVVSDGRVFENPHFSPDGRRLVVAATRRADPAADLWIHDLESGTASRFTFDHGRAPLWTPDGRAITYSHLGDAQGIYVKNADGRGDGKQLIALDAFHWLVGWTPDGRTLAYGLMEGASESSIVAFTDGDSRRIVGPGSIWGGRLSPNGRWLAYYSLQPGGFEIFVTPFPAGQPRWLIAEGTDPRWAPDGGELYYRSAGRLVAARLDMESGVQALSQRVVIEPFLPPLFDDYDIHPDGRTLVMVRPVGEAVGREVVMVVNWYSALQSLIQETEQQ